MTLEESIACANDSSGAEDEDTIDALTQEIATLEAEVGELHEELMIHHMQGRMEDSEHIES